MTGADPKGRRSSTISTIEISPFVLTQTDRGVCGSMAGYESRRFVSLKRRTRSQLDRFVAFCP